MKQILIYDTTLRDGMQGENISFSTEEKIRIAKKLDELGVHYIEGGWPGSNPGVMEFFQQAKKIQFKNAKLVAFGSTRKPNILPEDNPNLNALIQSGTSVITIFGKSWNLHVEEIMGSTLKENLAMVEDSVAFLVSHNKEVIFDAEHFFDGYFSNSQYALSVLIAAIKGGAKTVVLCDTNGGTLPHHLEPVIKTVVKTVKKYEQEFNIQPVKIGIHTHNDCNLAIANSIVAVQLGATMVQGTINGYGERCGNADLTSIIPILSLKMDCTTIPSENIKKIRKISRFVCEIANMIPMGDRPFVGKSAFAHKGGIHVSAVRKNSMAYEHMNPELVGNKRRVLISEQSGKSNIEYKANELGIDLNTKGLDSSKLLSEIKKLELNGYTYDVADGSFKILMEKFSHKFKPCFELESFRVIVEKDKDKPCSSFATIKIKVDGKEELTAAEGQGPVGALDNALRKALDRFYPSLKTMHLVDFKVRVIDGRDGTGAKVRLLIESSDEDSNWSTIGVSEDIIEASWQALADSVQFKLGKENEFTNNIGLTLGENYE